MRLHLMEVFKETNLQIYNQFSLLVFSFEKKYTERWFNKLKSRDPMLLAQSTVLSLFCPKSPAFGRVTVIKASWPNPMGERANHERREKADGTACTQCCHGKCNKFVPRFRLHFGVT